MSLTKDIKSDIKAAKKIWFPWWALLCLGIASLPFYWLFDYFGKLNVALPTFNAIGVLGFAIAVKWKLRRYSWFWGTMTILAALHAVLLLFVPWTDRWVPAMVIAGIDSVDLVVILAILALVGKLMETPKITER